MLMKSKVTARICTLPKIVLRHLLLLLLVLQMIGREIMNPKEQQSIKIPMSDARFV